MSMKTQEDEKRVQKTITNLRSVLMKLPAFSHGQPWSLETYGSYRNGTFVSGSSDLDLTLNFEGDDEQMRIDQEQVLSYVKSLLDREPRLYSAVKLVCLKRAFVL